MITVVILTYNSQETIKKTLESVRDFKEVLLMDTGSRDATLNIAEKFPNAVLRREEFCGFGPLRNKAAALAQNEWILALDSDEVITPQLRDELLQASLDKECVYAFPFQNYYNNKLIKCCGWHPESHIRLYNRQKTRFDNAKVHEGVIKNGFSVKSFRNPIKHYPYRGTEDFLKKMQTYSSLFALQNKGKKRSSLPIAAGHGLFAFFKSYFLKKGLFGGREGFIISIYNANTAFYKYLKLMEK